jgi:hypothetical protein
VKKTVKKQKGAGIQQLTKTCEILHHSMHSTSTLGGFAQFLTYKVEKVGERVMRIDEYHTSQQCCICGKRIKRALSERFIMYDCGNRINRDLNSAINLLEYFLNQKLYFDFLSHQSSMTEESFRERLDLLRKTVSSPQAAVDGELVVNGRLVYKFVPHYSIRSLNNLPIYIK